MLFLKAPRGTYLTLDTDQMRTTCPLYLDSISRLALKSLAAVIQPTEFVERCLAMCDRLRNGKAWTDEERRLEKFWQQWANGELDRIAESERQKRMAEVVSGNG